MRTLYEQQHRHHSECGANRAVQLHTTRQLSAPSSELLRDKRLRAEACLCLLLRQQPAEGGMERDAELMERLQRIRALLVEVREDLKAGEGEILADADADTDAGAVPDAPDAEAAAPRRRGKPVVKIAAEGEEAADAGHSVAKRTRKPRRKKEEVENKELFAFYEQSLF